MCTFLILQNFLFRFENQFKNQFHFPLNNVSFTTGIVLLNCLTHNTQIIFLLFKIVLRQLIYFVYNKLL